MAFFIEELKEAFNGDVFLESKQCDCGECPECKAREKEAMDESVELTEKRNPENDEINTSLKKVASGKYLTKKDKQALADRGYEYDEEGRFVHNPKTGKRMGYAGNKSVYGPSAPGNYEEGRRQKRAATSDRYWADENNRWADESEKPPTDSELALDYADRIRRGWSKEDPNWSLEDARNKKVEQGKEDAKRFRDDADYYTRNADRKQRKAHDANRETAYRLSTHNSLNRKGSDDIDYAGYLDKEDSLGGTYADRHYAINPTDNSGRGADAAAEASKDMRPYSTKYKELTRDISDARNHMNFQHKYYDDETLDKELADYEQELRDPKQGYSRYSPRLSDKVAQRNSRQRDMDAASKTMQSILDRARKTRTKNESLEINEAWEVSYERGFGKFLWNKDTDEVIFNNGSSLIYQKNSGADYEPLETLPDGVDENMIAKLNESLEEAVALTEKQNHENDEINKTIWKAATRNHKYLTDKEKKALADRGITLNDDGSLTGKGGRRLEVDRTDVWGPSAPQSHEVNRSSWYYEPVNKQQARNDYARRTWSSRRKEGDRLSKVDYAGYLDKPTSEYDQDSRRADYLRLRHKGEDNAYQDNDSPESTTMRPYSDDYRQARKQYDDARRWRDDYQKEIDEMSPEEAEIQQKLAAKRERNDRERAEREASKQRYNDAVAARDKFMADIRAKRKKK